MTELLKKKIYIYKKKQTGQWKTKITYEMFQQYHGMLPIFM